MGWMTAIGEALKLLSHWVISPGRRAKTLEDEKQEALRRTKELAYGNDEKAMEKHIRNLPD